MICRETSRGRPLLRGERVAVVRAATFDLAREIDLSDAEYERLVSLLVEHAMERMAMVSAQEGSDGAALDVPAFQELLARQRQQVAQLMGEERAEITNGTRQISSCARK